MYRCSWHPRTRTRIGTHLAFPTTAISTVIIGEGRKKEFAKHAWVFQRYDAYTAFNLLPSALSSSSLLPSPVVASTWSWILR